MGGSGCTNHRRFKAGCKDCRHIDASYDRRRRRMIADGTWQYQVPAQTVLNHIATLREAGMSLAGIARAGAVAPKTVLALVHENRKVIHGPTAAAILAVQPQLTIPAGFVPAIGVTRRVRALVAFGYSLADIARRLDKHLQAVWEMAWERQMYQAVATYRAVSDLYEQLSTTPGPSVRARNTGRRNNWAPPAAWDDIDSPDAQPHEASDSDDVVDEVAIDRALCGHDVALTRLERHHAVHLGRRRDMPISLIAERLHLSFNSARVLAYKPLPADCELVA